MLKEKDKEATRRPTAEQLEPYSRCEHCGTYFNTRRELDHHQQEIHADELETKPTI